MTKRQLMKEAHRLAATFDGDYSACLALALRIVWQQAKTPQTHYTAIKSWFINKNFDQNERYIYDIEPFQIKRETEKALQLKWISEFGVMTKWVPKSCMVSQEEAEMEFEQAAERFNKYQQLIAWAKANEVKGVRNRMKKATVIVKIQQAGLAVPAELA